MSEVSVSVTATEVLAPRIQRAKTDRGPRGEAFDRALDGALSGTDTPVDAAGETRLRHSRSSAADRRGAADTQPGTRADAVAHAIQATRGPQPDSDTVTDPVQDAGADHDRAVALLAQLGQPPAIADLGVTADGAAGHGAVQALNPSVTPIPSVPADIDATGSAGAVGSAGSAASPLGAAVPAAAPTTALPGVADGKPTGPVGASGLAINTAVAVTDGGASGAAATPPQPVGSATAASVVSGAAPTPGPNTAPVAGPVTTPSTDPTATVATSPSGDVAIATSAEAETTHLPRTTSTPPTLPAPPAFANTDAGSGITGTTSDPDAAATVGNTATWGGAVAAAGRSAETAIASPSTATSTATSTEEVSGSAPVTSIPGASATPTGEAGPDADGRPGSGTPSPMTNQNPTAGGGGDDAPTGAVPQGPQPSAPVGTPVPAPASVPGPVSDPSLGPVPAPVTSLPEEQPVSPPVPAPVTPVVTAPVTSNPGPTAPLPDDGPLGVDTPASGALNPPPEPTRTTAPPAPPAPQPTAVERMPVTPTVGPAEPRTSVADMTDRSDSRLAPPTPTPGADRVVTAAPGAPFQPIGQSVAPAAAAHAGISTPMPHSQVVSAVGPLLRGPDGSYSLQLNLLPAHLGNLRLSVELRGGEVAIQMHAIDSQARDLLKDNLGTLRQELQQLGLKAGNLDVSTGRDQSNRQWAAHQGLSGGGGNASGRGGRGGAPGYGAGAAGPDPTLTSSADDAALDLRM